MSNMHGHLPKAERDHLPAELQQRLEAWTTKAYTDDNLFLTLAQSPGVKFLRMEHDRAVLTVQSGSYHFASEL